MKSSISLFLLVILCVMQFSCKNDNPLNNDTLIGQWLRSDFNANAQYTITFEENNIGSIINQETTVNGIISNIVSIDWNVTNTVLTITQDDVDIDTTFEFTSNGNLFLADFSTFDFIKQ